MSETLLDAQMSVWTLLSPLSKESQTYGRAEGGLRIFPLLWGSFHRSRPGFDQPPRGLSRRGVPAPVARVHEDDRPMIPRIAVVSDDLTPEDSVSEARVTTGRGANSS